MNKHDYGQDMDRTSEETERKARRGCIRWRKMRAQRREDDETKKNSVSVLTKSQGFQNETGAAAC